jgi:hypothetical protein
MPSEIDPKVADSLVLTAVSGLWPLPSEKILCMRRALKQAFLAVAQEAYGLGFLAGQEVRLRESTAPGSADRPAWMDTRLDDQAAIAANHLRLRPIVLRSLLDAGYQCLGDLRWVPIQQLIRVFYIGRKTAKQIRSGPLRSGRWHWRLTGSPGCTGGHTGGILCSDVTRSVGEFLAGCCGDLPGGAHW